MKLAHTLVAAALVAGCGGKRAVPAPAPAPAPGVRPLPESIGAATMEPDGTIVLELRAEGPNGELGDALIRVAPSDPNYAPTLEHLGPMEPGESKLVAPWPDAPR